MSAYTYGLEFEIAGISPHTAANALTRSGIQCVEPNRTHETAETWKAVYDGSVRDGAEIVSPILDGVRLNEANGVARALLNSGARVNRATGFHVHIGFNSFGNNTAERLNTLSTFMLNWYAAHSTIGALVAPSRLDNRFCKAITMEHAEQNAQRILNGNISDYRGDRYQSLNLMSFERHSTIETRLHQGTLNGIKAVAWSQFISGMIEHAKTGSRLPARYESIDQVARLNNITDMLQVMALNGYITEKVANYLTQRAADLSA